MIGLEHKAGDPIANLPLGERKLVGVARALSMQPRLLMLDEPVGGLAAHEINKLVDLIYKLRSEGLTIFIVEHNMPFVMSLSEKVLVLDGGAKIAEGPPEEIKRNEAVIKAYLGEEVALTDPLVNGTLLGTPENDGTPRLGWKRFPPFMGKPRS